MSHAALMPRLYLFSALWSASLAAQAGEALPEVPAGTRIVVGRGPADMIFSADGKNLYVTENDDNTVAVIDVSGARVLRRIGGSSQPPAAEDGCMDNFCRGKGATGIAVDRDQQRAYVSSWEINALTAFDLGNGQALWSTALQRFPQTVLMTPDGTQAWTFNLVANSISVVNAATGAAMGEEITLEGGDARYLPFGRPLAFAMARDGRHVYAGSVHSNSIDVFDVAERSRSARIDSEGTPHDLAVDAETGNVVALFSDGVVEYDGQKLAPLRAYRFCGEMTTWNIAVSADGRSMALTFPQQALALVVDRNTGLLTHVFRTDDWPSTVAFSPDSHRLAVLNAGKTPSVSLLDVHTAMALEPLRSWLGELFCQPDTENVQWMR